MSLVSKVKAHLESLGASPKRALGQNFLVDEQAIDRIIDKATGYNPNLLVEVGPGLGALTEKLRMLARPLLVIELDTKFAQHWREQSVTVIEADALKVNWNDLDLATNTVVVSNLPYQISSSLVIERSLGPTAVEHMILMFQKEVAQRIVAGPGSKDYGLLSVMAQTFWAIQNLLEVGPSSFYPRPKIASRVLVFDRILPGTNDKLKEIYPKKERYLKYLKVAFSQRRKKMIKALSASWPEVNWKAAMEACGVSADARAETVSVNQFQALFLSLQ